jgi:hypothetical protein
MRDVGATRALLLRLVLPKRLVSSHVANNEEKCPRIPCTWKEGLGMDRSDSPTRGFGRKWELFVPPRFNGVFPLYTLRKPRVRCLYLKRGFGNTETKQAYPCV